MNKNLLILFCLFSLMQVSRAQDPIFGEPQHSTLSADSLSDVVGLIPESLDANVDSFLHSWHVQYFSKVDEYVTMMRRMSIFPIRSTKNAWNVCRV